MKNKYLFLLTFISQVAFAQNEFITRWDLSRSGSGVQQINFDVTATGPVSYTWQEVSPGTESGGGSFNSGNVTICSVMPLLLINLLTTGVPKVWRIWARCLWAPVPLINLLAAGIPGT